MARKLMRIDGGQRTLYGNKLIDDTKFTKTELIVFSSTDAKDLTEEQLVTRCRSLQYGVCHLNSKGHICKGICDKWFTNNGGESKRFATNGLIQTGPKYTKTCRIPLPPNNMEIIIKSLKKFLCFCSKVYSAL